MGKIFYLMGKSASGKDTLYGRLLARLPQLGTYVMYSTRPMRTGEQDGVSYNFVKPEMIDRAEADGRLIEKRVYETVYGPWIYATIDDGQIELSEGSYLMTGTIESYLKLREYYGAESIRPLYIEVDDGIRLMRAVERERRQKKPAYKELCRRFIADSEDFDDARLAEAGIDERYTNDDIDRCTEQLAGVIEQELANGGIQ